MCYFSHPGNAYSHRNKQEAKSHVSFGICSFSHPANALSHRNKQEAKSHLSFGMCVFSPPKFPINVHFFAATRSRQNHTIPSQCALFRIWELHFLTATSKKQNPTVPSEWALCRRQMFRFHPLQKCSKTSFSNKRQATGTTSKIKPFLWNVRFFAATTSKSKPFVRNMHFCAATSNKQNQTSGMCTFSPPANLSSGMCTFSPPEYALFRRNKQAKSNLSSGVCTFSPPKQSGLLESCDRRVDFSCPKNKLFLPGMCTF